MGGNRENNQKSTLSPNGVWWGQVQGRRGAGSLTNYVNGLLSFSTNWIKWNHKTVEFIWNENQFVCTLC